MIIVLPLVVVAVVAGLVTGGSLRAFERVRVHWWGAAVGGLALQAVPAGQNLRLAAATLVGSYVLLVGFALVNRRLPGGWLVMAGLAMNLAVVLPNGGMPVSAAAVSVAGAPAGTVVAGDLKRHEMTSGDVLRPLGDVIPVPKPVGIVLSVGDLALYSGVAWFLLAVMLGRPAENRRPPARRFLMYRGKHLAPELRFPRQTLARWAASGRLPATARSGTSP